MLDPAVDNPFAIGLQGPTIPDSSVKVYINDSTEPVAELFSNYFEVTLNDGDYVRCYVNEEGPVSIDNAITNVATTSAVYNLAGQKVSKDYKGIVIKNSKKVVLK